MLVPMMVSCTKELDLEVHELSDNVSDNKTLEVLIETATVPLLQYFFEFKLVLILKISKPRFLNVILTAADEE